jgi:hypothetical protein
MLCGKGKLMEITKLNREITFVLCYVNPKKVFQYTRRNHNELQTIVPGLISTLRSSLMELSPS